MKKLYIVALILAGAAVVIWQISRDRPAPSNQSGPRQKPAVAVEITPVTNRTIHEVGTYTGTLLPESQFIVAPKIAGKLEKIFVNIGDTVTQGQLIATLDDAEYVQQVDQAKAELDVAQATIEETRSDLSLKQREFERARALREKKIVSEAELDAAEAQYKAALAKQKVAYAQAAQKEAELKTAQVRLGYTRISALWENGDQSRVVGERYVDEGAMLSSNSPIVSVIDISTLKAVIYVIERDYPRVSAGQGAMISTDAYPDRTFTGTIARVAPVLKEAARQARVEITVPNHQKDLKPGMFVRVQIEFDRHENATVVPFNALVKSNGNTSIFLVDMETLQVKRVPVEIGIIEGDLAEVLNPSLSDGFVVTVGQHLLEDGSQITLPEKDLSIGTGQNKDTHRGSQP